MTGFLLFAVRRVAGAALTLFFVTIVVFAAIHWLPGSYADVFLAAHPTPQVKARIEETFGLDQPLLVQYLRWMSAAARGNFGISLVTQTPVADEFRLRIPVTVQLAAMATCIAITFGVPLGIIGGFARRRIFRELFRLWGSAAISVPDFVIGSLLIYIVTRHAIGLSPGAWISPVDDFAGSLQVALLPAVTLASLGVGFVMTTARHATISIRESPWMAAAVARGKSAPAIVRQHVIKNVSIPVVTVIAIYVGYLLGGTAVVESLFTTPGLGRYIVQAVELRDYPVVQAGVLLAAVVFVVLNLCADLLYSAFDPRIRA